MMKTRSFCCIQFMHAEKSILFYILMHLNSFCLRNLWLVQISLSEQSKHSMFVIKFDWKRNKNIYKKKLTNSAARKWSKLL